METLSISLLIVFGGLGILVGSASKGDSKRPSRRKKDGCVFSYFFFVCPEITLPFFHFQYEVRKEKNGSVFDRIVVRKRQWPVGPADGCGVVQ
jgi:hypothetical protein